MQNSCAALYYHLWPAWLYHIFPHYLKKRHDFRKDTREGTEYVFSLPLQLLSQTFLLLWRIQRDIIIHASSSKVPVTPCRILIKHNFLDIFLKNHSNFRSHENPSRVTELLHTGGRTDRQTWRIIDEWKTNLMSLAILFHLLCAQHVSDINISIFRSLRLCW